MAAAVPPQPSGRYPASCVFATWHKPQYGSSSSNTVTANQNREGPLADIVFGLLIAVPALALIATFVVEKRRRRGTGKSVR